MTVTYSLTVSTSRPWTFFKLLFKWRGSVWKAVWIQYVVWLTMYAILTACYRAAMNDHHKKVFNNVAKYFDSKLSYIPLEFILGFFVTAILDRWKYLYNIIGWIEDIAMFCSMYIRGDDERAKMYRRAIVRHCELVQVLVFRDLSVKTKKRLPTLETVKAAGFMSEHEYERFEDIQYRYKKYFFPFSWAWALTYNARKEGYIESDYFQQELSAQIKKFRTDLAWLCNYDWCPLPLIYPTIVSFIVHIYFLVAVLSRQHLKDGTFDMWFPVMTSIQFFLYMGWMKTAEGLLNPWGEDDDDFETNALIDRNLEMGLKIVDAYGQTPELKKDIFWEKDWVPMYAEDCLADNTKRSRSDAGSASNIKLPGNTSVIRMVPQPGIVKKPEGLAHIVPVKPEDTEIDAAMGTFRGMVRNWSTSTLIFGRTHKNELLEKAKVWYKGDQARVWKH